MSQGSTEKCQDFSFYYQEDGRTIKTAAHNQATKHGISNLLTSDPRLSSRETHDPCTWRQYEIGLLFKVWLRNCSVLAEFGPRSRPTVVKPPEAFYFILLPTSKRSVNQMFSSVFFFRFRPATPPFQRYSICCRSELQPVGLGTGSYSCQARLSVKASFLAVNLKCKLRSTDQTTHWVRTRWC